MANTAASLLKENEYIKLNSKRWQYYAEIETILEQFLKMTADTVSATRFLALEQELNVALEEVKKRQELIIKYFINKDVDIAKDEFVKQDKLDYQKRIMQVTEEADKLRVGLETNGKLKTVKNDDSAAGITELCTTLSKSLNTSALKPTQPIFDPKGTKDDYIKYREWRTRFVFFVKHLDHMDKHV